MSNVLLISSSLFGEQSQSLGLAREFLARHAHSSVVERVLAPDSMPHLDAETLAAMATPDEQRTERQARLVISTNPGGRARWRGAHAVRAAEIWTWEH